jgi:hypothetical protein
MDVDAQVGEQSATLSVSSNNEGFPEFAELSYELRALIWKEAIQSPKIIEVEGHLVERKPSLGWDKPLVYDLRLSMTSSKTTCHNYSL